MANGFEIKLGEAFVYEGDFGWSLFREQYQGSEFFTDIRRVPDVEQIKFLG